MKTPASPLSLFALIAAILLSFSLSASAKTAAQLDLDRDGIPNISDRDVDNDGILNGSDRNIDGGVARSGPLRGRYIGDNLLNNSPQELDMDADGQADNALNEADIDGDSQLDNAPAETDIDGDGLADNAASETDIDGDGLADGARGEVDTDGDASANGLDGDVDGDGLANNSDPDMHGTGDINDIFQLPGSEEAYADDAPVASTIAYVSGQIRQKLQIPATDQGLRVRVNPVPFGSFVTGAWRYLSSDNIQVWGKWCHPLDNPASLNIATQYSYGGPLFGSPADYVNPANYSISEESRVYSAYPGGGGNFVSWLPQQPAGFYFSVPSAQTTGFAPPAAPDLGQCAQGVSESDLRSPVSYFLGIPRFVTRSPQSSTLDQPPAHRHASKQGLVWATGGPAAALTHPAPIWYENEHTEFC